VRVVYGSTSLALAAVETFVNLEPILRPGDLVFIEGDIPEAVEIPKLDLKTLPRGWHESKLSPGRAGGFMIGAARSGRGSLTRPD
jgi:hypothetical protein